MNPSITPRKVWRPVVLAAALSAALAASLAAHAQGAAGAATAAPPSPARFSLDQPRAAIASAQSAPLHKRGAGRVFPDGVPRGDSIVGDWAVFDPATPADQVADHHAVMGYARIRPTQEEGRYRIHYAFRASEIYVLHTQTIGQIRPTEAGPGLEFVAPDTRRPKTLIYDAKTDTLRYESGDDAIYERMDRVRFTRETDPFWGRQ